MSLGKTFFKNIYKLHIYAGLFVAVHFAVFALSGLVLLFKDEIQGEAKKSQVAQKLTPAETARSYQTIFEDLKRQFPQDRPLAFFPDDEDHNLINTRLGLDGATKLRGARRSAYHLSTATEVVEPPAPASGFFQWMLVLHRELFLGSNGKIYLGFVGLAYVFMLLSGFFLYGKFMKGRSLGEIRPGRILTLVDLHKYVGVISFGWGLVVGLSGVFLAFNGILIQLFQALSLKHLSQQYQTFESTNLAQAPLDQVVATALAAKPESVITYLSFPDTEFGIPGHFLFLVNGTTALTERISELVVINAHTAGLAEIVELPLYLKIVLLSEPLHFGDYGGITLKIIWAFFTLCSLAVAVFGIVTFILKRRVRSRGVTAADQIKGPALRKSTNQSPYLIPIVVAVVSIAAMVMALFLTGIAAKMAVALFIVPISILLLKRGRRG